MIIAFTLSMPGSPSWNGKWSGENDLYVQTRSFTTNAQKEVAHRIIAKGYYTYSWSDGWRAAIDVRQVSSVEAKRLNKTSKGFCNYEWMIDSIIKNNEIICSI